jgi:HSP20 family protein
MTLVKFKRPTVVGETAANPVVLNSPFSGLFENLLGDNFFTREFASFVPAVNFSEETGHYNLELSAPGFEKNDFKIKLADGVLTISGEHKSETETSGKNYTRKEFSLGSFERSFNLPDGINESAVDAKYENGILKVSLAKKAEVIKEAVEIKIS